MTLLRLLALSLLLSVGILARSPYYEDTLIDRDWKMVATGYGHTLALTKNGSLFVWGSNEYGQLGVQRGFWSPKIEYQRTPVAVMPEWRFKFVTAGYFTSFAIRDDGSLFAWGLNEYSNLGIGICISFGERTLEYESWPVQVGDGKDWKEIAAGNRNVLGLKNDGSLYAWGDAVSGIFGFGKRLETTTPVRLYFGFQIKSIAAGQETNFAITTDGKLFAWGYNDFGQLATNTTKTQYYSNRIYGGSNNTWKAVASGVARTFAIDSEGFIYGWGADYNNTLRSTPNLTMTKMSDRNDWKTVTAGAHHFIASTENGTIYSLGYNHHGQLGDGTKNDSDSFKLIETRGNWTQVACGFYHCLGISSGAIKGWGFNVKGQLGDNTTTIFRLTPNHIAPRTNLVKPGSWYLVWSKTTLLITLAVALASFLVLCCCCCCCRRKKTPKPESPIHQGTYIAMITVPELTLYQNNHHA